MENLEKTKAELIKEEVYKLIKTEKLVGEKEIRIQTGLLPEVLKLALSELEKDGEIVRSKRGKLMLPEYADCYKGILEVKRAGFAFAANPDGDIFIRKEDLHGALNGEEVLVRLLSNSRGESREGEVVRILSKGTYTLTGTVHFDNEEPYVLADDRTLGKVFLSKNDKYAENENVVIAEVLKRGERGLYGKVCEVLGKKGDEGVDILAIAKRFGMEEIFPKEVLEELKDIPKSVSEAELKGRRLLFNEKVLTIDGETAKDLDDAISLSHTKDGNRVLGVHIADVSHYVKENSAIDKEALKRGTSVYLLDRVIPMLPKELSNGICSLNENEIRLTISCFMKFDKDGNVVESGVEKTAIKSVHRLSYTAVNAMLGGDSEAIKEYRDIYDDITELHELSLQLRSIRHENGSVDFDLPEAEIELNESGEPISIGLRERGEGERLIEDFMIKANECVSEQFSEYPFLYRIHEEPSMEKVHDLAEFLSGFNIRIGTKLTGKDTQKILERVKGLNCEALVNNIVLRTMQKARYSAENCGHFGLASEAYSHFTSPIRRYPDLQIHRIISEYLYGNLNERRQKHYERLLPSVANSTSDSEVKAVEAERKVNDIKKAQYMSKFIGEKFIGIVSGITGTAMFVELENTIEGIVSYSEIRDDYYEVYEKLHCIIGRRTGRRISLGDEVRVILLNTDEELGRVEFGIISKDKASYSNKKSYSNGSKYVKKYRSNGTKNFKHYEKKQKRRKGEVPGIHR